MLKRKIYFKYFIILSLLMLVFSSVGSYTVKSGDTLWDISAEFLQDPFKWPDVWKRNPNISNPDRIYPGDKINIDGSEQVTFSEKEAPSNSAGRPRVNFHQEMKGFSKKERTPPVRAIATPAAPDNSTGAKTIVQELVTKGPFLKKPLRKKQFYNDQLDIHFYKKNGAILKIMEEFEIQKGEVEGIKLNDRYQIFSIGKKQKSTGTKKFLGSTLTINGIAKVVRLEPTKAVLILEKCFGKITEKNKASLFKPQAPLSVEGYKQYGHDNIKAKIIHVSNSHATIAPYTYVIIDGGSSIGFQKGDGVVLFDRPAKSKSPATRALGTGIVIRNHSDHSTILIKRVLPGPLNKGDYVIARHSAELAG